jgi:ribose/xylose/arabinose/galactoside ABC-type transport system permease subunit
LWSWAEQPGRRPRRDRVDPAGALTIGYLEKILSINAVGEAARLMLTGLIIILAVIFQRGGKR